MAGKKTQQSRVVTDPSWQALPGVGLIEKTTRHAANSGLRDVSEQSILALREALVLDTIEALEKALALTESPDALTAEELLAIQALRTAIVNAGRTSPNRLARTRQRVGARYWEHATKGGD